MDRSQKAILAGCTGLALSFVTATAQQQGRPAGANSAFPGGTNADGSLRPTPPLTRLFTQDAYTEYEILAPGTEQFRIRFLPEEPRAGSKELVNATRGGSEGSGVEVFDPRTGKPLQFTYQQMPDDPDSHAIHATLPIPVPEGGVGRVLIYKTYKDARTYQMHGGDIAWIRSLAGYRLGVVLPPHFSFISSNVAAQLSTTSTGQLKIAFANPSGQSNPTMIHARKTAANFTPTTYTDMFFDDVKTLYDLGDPASHIIQVEQTYSDYRKGTAQKLDSLSYLKLRNMQAIDLDTAKPFVTTKQGTATAIKLEVPIENDKQSVHVKLTGELNDPSYTDRNGTLTFDRPMHGLRNTVLLPAGYEVSAVSQSGTLGMYRGRPFVALINLNAGNDYRVVIQATKIAGSPAR